MKMDTWLQSMCKTFSSFSVNGASRWPSLLLSSWMTATASPSQTTGAQSMDRGTKSPELLPPPPQRLSFRTSGTFAISLFAATQPAMELSGEDFTRKMPSTPWATELQSSLASLSTTHSVARSQDMDVRPSAMTVFMIVSSSLAFFARSEACKSMRRRFDMPSRQPTTTPQTPPKVETRLVMPNRCCESVSPGSGRPSFKHTASMVPPKVTPHVSLKTCPMAAAARVGRPRQTPTVLSMASPAQMSTL
mmetsp:Transcript_119048/g.370869  ORF Transcript_119048/g.370869 Transcript_119048/m.370869 type:complete len:248 (+) Transcript_119048:91-834(+)